MHDSWHMILTSLQAEGVLQDHHILLRGTEWRYRAGRKDGLTGGAGYQKPGLGALCQAKHVESTHERRFQGFDRIDLVMRR